MSTILVLDTSQAKTWVAISLSGRVTARVSEESRQAAQQLLPLIQQVLESSSTVLAEVDAIAVVTGPGSFTGLRIGIGVAQGLGASLEVPLLGLSSLALQAFAAKTEYGCSHSLVAQRARDNELYLAAYQVDSRQACLLHGHEQVVAEQQLGSVACNLLIQPDLISSGPWWAIPGTGLNRQSRMPLVLAPR